MFPSNPHNNNTQTPAAQATGIQPAYDQDGNNAPAATVAPPQEDPIYGPWLEYLMDEMARDISRGSLHNFVPTLTPQQLSGEENQEPLDAIPWVAPEDFRPHSDDDLLQIESSLRLSQGARSEFMQAVHGMVAQRGSLAVGHARRLYEFSHDNDQVRLVDNNRPNVPAFLVTTPVPPQGPQQEQLPPQEPPQAAQVPSQADGYLSGPANPKYSVLNYQDNGMPASGLIRDGVAPHYDDFSNEALVWRVAASATGRQTDFTFTDHWSILYETLHNGLVNELNRKLEAGINGIQTKVLLRNIPDNYMEIAAENQMVLFSKMGMQTWVNWRYCPEHLRMLSTMNLANPYIDAAGLDRLVKAAGAWTLNWAPQ